MDRIDEFESMFRRAERESYEFAEISISRITLVSDLPASECDSQIDQIKACFTRLSACPNWNCLGPDDFRTVDQLLDLVAQHAPELIVTHRNLQERSLTPQHSLGVYLDVLTQATTTPVLVLPGSAARPVALDEIFCKEVMVLTDHISGDSRLINFGLAMCGTGGTVFLCHVEDDLTFERYMKVIEKIPDIPSDVARAEIDRQLRKEAEDFIESCIREIETRTSDFVVKSQVTRGHRLQEYRSIIQEHDIDLLVVNTKDHSQLAMHGMAYSIAVELESIPLLLL